MQRICSVEPLADVLHRVLFDALDEDLARYMEDVRLGKKALTDPEDE